MISEKEIERIARLARLKLERKEFEKLKNDFLKILEFVEKLKEVKIPREILEKKDFEVTNILRGDKKEKFDFNEETLISQVPERMGSYLKIKRILRK